MTRILANENRPLETIIPTADRVQYDLANDCFVERGNIVPKEAILILLPVVPGVYRLPKLVIKKKKSLPELNPAAVGGRRRLGAILVDYFRLSQISAKGPMGTKESQRSLGHPVSDHQFGVIEQLKGGSPLQHGVVRFS